MGMVAPVVMMMMMMMMIRMIRILGIGLAWCLGVQIDFVGVSAKILRH